MWPDCRLIELLEIEFPIVQAPMAGAMDWELAAAVAEAGALGSLPSAMLNADQVREQMGKFRARTAKPVNLNFFCHAAPELNNAREARWREALTPYYRELGIDPAAPVPSSNRAAFDATFCEVVEELKPQVVSFHFGLPAADLVQRVKAAGAIVISSATTAAEARWLEARGVDAVIAQGCEAGGHRGLFLTDDTDDIATQVGTFALIPQIVDAVTVPVIAAGAVTDARGIVAALALGAAGVQIGSAYLWCPEARISAPHRAKAEAQGSGDFSPMWAGQAAGLGRALPAGELTRRLAAEALERMRSLTSSNG
jgi:nitronate monooxygenase